ncbi:hypothetical protein LXT21_29525 [Myxococcus sp. K38C18041901]|uniref:hypothetical protein n=1 Tax=Myxococcus guangdongensis TaxID=2906760 RepID=UPI0020A76D23|nr:hypothetical protein [Myxococcus guangdongensis]MCP3062932.1 hypothetical protein [Myxococcus guangdongensis]
MSPALFLVLVGLQARDYRWARCNRAMALDSVDRAERRDGVAYFRARTASFGWWCSLWPVGGWA